MFQELMRRSSLIGVFVKAHSEEILYQWRPVPIFRQMTVVRLIPDDWSLDFFLGRSVKGELTTHHDEDKDTQGPYVYFLWVAFLAKDLRCHIDPRPQILRRCLVLFDMRRKPEVCQFADEFRNLVLAHLDVYHHVFQL